MIIPDDCEHVQLGMDHCKLISDARNNPPTEDLLYSIQA